jgi:glycosyltransferase involved in cell wall biosynthesis
MDRSVYILPAMPNNYIELFTDSLPDDATVYTNETRHPFTPFLLDVVRHRPNTIHLHWPHPYFLFFGAVPTRALSSVASAVAAAVFLIQLRIASMLVESVVWTVHNRQNHDRRKPRIERAVHRRIALIADTVTVWDDHTEDVVVDEFGADADDVTIIPHNNYCPIYGETSLEADGGDLHGPIRDVSEFVQGYDRVVLYFGRIRPYKNVAELVSTFDGLDADDACLVIAGNPKDYLRDDLETAIADADDVVGDLRYIPDAEVPAYFDLADIAVFLYDKIFNSGSVVLAMSFGTPFVAPDMGAIDGLAPPGNVVYQDLGDGLQTAIAMSDAEIRRAGGRNRRQADQEHSQEAVREAAVEAYGWG